jgi:alginate O-acetyltransferase complex protein AlgJ
LNVSAFSNVLRGKEGWLLYTGEGNLDDYQNAHPFSATELEDIGDKLGAVQQWMDEKGITFFVVVAPNKETIYPEFVPDEINKIGDQSRLEQLAAFLKSSSHPVKLLDVRPALLARKEEFQLYYRTDSHWNDYGAYFASAEILKAVEEKFPEVRVAGIEDYRIEKGDVSGDLARMLPMEPLLSETTVWLHRYPDSQVRFPEKTDRVITISEADNPNLPRAVIFRDSFANQLEPFLSEGFSRAVYPWSFTIDQDLINREQADVVIVEIAERYLHLLKDIQDN